MPDLLQLLATNLQTVQEPDLVFRCMHDSMKSAGVRQRDRKQGALTERAKAARSPKPVLSERRSLAAKKSSEIRSSEALVLRGQTVFPAEIILLKQLYTGVGSWSYEEFLQRVRAHPSLQRLVPLLPMALSRKLGFEELLVKLFREVNRREMGVMLRWVAGEDQLDSEAEQKATAVPAHSKALFTSAADVQALFSLYDSNKDGSLSLPELQSALGHLLSHQDITALFSSYDANHDQRISLTEFMCMMSPE